MSVGASGSDVGRSPDPRGPTGRRRAEALLYAQRLTKLYPLERGLLRKPKLLYALSGASFYVRDRETFGVVGESGSGKSTLGRCLLRLVEPTFGRVVFDGRDITALGPGEMRSMRQRMQIVFQNPFASLDPNFTVRASVGEGIEVFRLARSRAEMTERVDTVLEQVGLDPRIANRYPHELSGGQCQRVAIARALAVRPDFIVLDEPLSSLDLSVQAQILNLLDDLQESLGLSLLLISHDLRAVQYLSHRLCVMVHGKIVEMGPTEAVARRQHHPYTRELFGALPAGFWRGKRRSAPPSESERSPGDERKDDDSEERELDAADGAALPLAGPPQSALEPPRGCVYAPRCPRAEPGHCELVTPELVELSGRSHHRVACWHPHIDDAP
jgi:oligopeptide transport system ATP-binding protein